MKVCHLALTLFALSPFANAVLANSPEEWKIDSLTLAPDTDPANRLPDGGAPNKLRVAVSNRELGLRFNLSGDVRLTAVKESFTTRDKLVIIGDATTPYEVVVFDLSSRRLVDWFYCYAPHRVSSAWIAYVEWYPNHGMGVAKEVLLVYDLTKTPDENRLPSAERLPIPAALAGGAAQVGIPIFPESNVQQQSYVNAVEDPADGDVILQNAGYLLLPSGRLAFVAAQGQGFANMRNYLVVVDLSHGVDHPSVETIDIPKDQLQKPGENPRFVKITGIEPVSEDAVRLLVPKSEYGVSSIIVSLPR